MNRVISALRGCTAAKRLGTSLLALTLAFCTAGAVGAQENPDPSLLGVTRSQIESNGLPASLVTSARGVNQQGAQQIPRSGFDLINNGTTGTVLLRGVRLFPNPVACASLSNDAFFLSTVAGRPGDGDGDGAYSSNAGPCAARRNNNPANPKIIDGVSPADAGLLTFGENLRIRLDRNCDGKADLVFSLTNDPFTATLVRVESDDFTGFGGTTIGGEGVAWEAEVWPGTSYSTPCPDPASITGHYIVRIPDFSKYFLTANANNPGGLSPTNFGFIITAGSDDDGLEEDLISGNVDVPEPIVNITKGPDLALCPGTEGNWTITVSNDGNTLLEDLVVTDALPAGVTLVNVVSGGVTASGNTGTITFSPFDLAQCESKEIVIRVRANDNCAGNGVNSASVAGVFASRCAGKAPGELTQQAITAGPATANFTCLVRPCVTVAITPISAQCPGTAVTVNGTVTNCANGDSRLWVRLGDGTEVDLGVVAAGQSVPFSLPAGNLVCTTGSSVYTVNARGEGSELCPGTTDSENVTVNCKPVPCVSIVLDALPAQCPATAVNVTGTATNCGLSAATLYVRIGDGSESNLGSVPAGESVPFSLPAGNIACPGGSNYTVNARADVPGEDDCPGTTDSESVSVACKAVPCVSITVDPLDPQCPGTQVNVTGNATNCGDAAATLYVRLGDGSETNLGLVGAGQSAPYSLPAGAIACPGGSTYTVNARADVPGEEDCPGTGDSESVTVTCKPVPCVSIVLDALPAQCPGTNVTVTGTATNCGTSAATLYVRLGDGVEVNLGVVNAGQSAAISLPAGAIACPGGSNYTVNARADVPGENDCPGTTDSESVSVACKAVPCVSIIVNSLDPQCVGTPVTVTGTATNCGSSAANLFVRLGAGTEVDLGSVASGQSAPFSLPAGNLVCESGSASYTVNARADVPGENDCPGTTDSESVSISCRVAQIAVTKTGPTSVANGATISYEIIVSNPSATTPLEDVRVVDVLCNYVRDARNFAGTCTAVAPQVTGNTITWPEFDLAAGASCTITFDVTADVTVGGAACPTTVNCVNNVRVSGGCPGGGDGGRVEASDDHPTNIVCASDNCPRTVGFWGSQCAQKPNGSTKFTYAQVADIAQCISSRSAYFNWSTSDDREAFEAFCALINPNIMNQRVQALRQFAGFLANICTDQLNLQPSRGGKIYLDPNTPISCGGFTADTLGELIDEIDAELLALHGLSLNDPDVKARYARIISCADGINNGRNIPVSSDCSDGGTAPTGEVFDAPAVDQVSVELYKPAPNPFSGSMSFSYSVNGTDNASVDITVFDVAGRQIRKLVSGTEAAGVHVATWDGRSDSGVRVNRGVYFVRTVIAGRKEATNRVLFLTEGR